MDSKNQWYLQRDGKVEGPMPSETVMARRFAGFIEPSTPISRDGRVFRPFSEFELEGAFKSHTALPEPPVVPATPVKPPGVVVVCSHCGAKNSAPRSALGRRGRCFACNQPMIIVERLPENPAQVVVQSRKPGSQTSDLLAPTSASPVAKKPEEKLPAGHLSQKEIITYLGIGLVTIFFLTGGAKGCFKESPEEEMEKARIMAMVFVEKQLKAPSTAVFPVEDRAWKVTRLEPGKYHVESYVDAQNSFGVMLRTTFVCVLHRDPKNGEHWILDILNIDQ